MTDYQRIFIDNVAYDIDDIFCGHLGQHFDTIVDEIKTKVESRIEAYDNERREQYIKALSESLPRLVSEVI